MSILADRAWIGGPITDPGDPTQLGMGAGWQIAGHGTGPRPVIPRPVTPAAITSASRGGTSAFLPSGAFVTAST
jgi:hypothetical protein